MFEVCASSIDYDPPEFYNARIVAALKPHICDECGSTIHVREKYEYVCGKYDGHICQFHTCMPCKRIRDGLFRNGFLHGGLSEMLCDHYDINFFITPPDSYDEETDMENEIAHIRRTRKALGLPEMTESEIKTCLSVGGE